MESRSEECSGGPGWRRTGPGPGPGDGEASGAVVRELLSQLTTEMSKEERLRGVVEALFEGVLSEPDFSVAYTNVCCRYIGVKVPTSDNPGVTTNFRKMLLNRCEKEFKKDKDDEISEQKKKELYAATEDEEHRHLTEELDEVKEKFHRRYLSNVKFISELFNFKILTAPIMHDCIVKLLKKKDEESLECLCTLLSTAGKNLDFEKQKPRMDQYCNSMDKIVKERTTSSRIGFMLQEILDLRRKNWVPSSGNQGPKIIDQIQKMAELEEQIKVHVQLLSNKNSTLGYGVRRLHSSSGRITHPQNRGWNKVPISHGGSGTKPSVEHGRKGMEARSDEYLRTQGQWRREERPREAEGAGAAPTPQMFALLMKQLSELNIDTEERLKGVVDVVFEEAISKPDWSAAYANLCYSLMGLKATTSDNPHISVNFRKLLLNRCQKEFEKDESEIFKQMKNELDAATEDKERLRLTEELEEVKDKAHHRSLGNIKLIGELFHLRMLTDEIMHQCILKLLKKTDEESLECACTLLSTAGKKLDYERSKPRMDQYFYLMKKIIKEKKTSSRISFMLQDILDLRQSNWVPSKSGQGMKTFDQVHKRDELEEQITVRLKQLFKMDSPLDNGIHRPPFTSSKMRQPQEGWNKVPISRKGSGAKPRVKCDSGRSSTSILNRFIAPQDPASSSMSLSSSLNSKTSEPAAAAPLAAKAKATPDLWTSLSARAALVALLQSDSADSDASQSPPPAPADNPDLLETK